MCICFTLNALGTPGKYNLKSQLIDMFQGKQPVLKVLYTYKMYFFIKIIVCYYFRWQHQRCSIYNCLSACRLASNVKSGCHEWFSFSHNGWHFWCVTLLPMAWNKGKIRLHWVLENRCSQKIWHKKCMIDFNDKIGALRCREYALLCCSTIEKNKCPIFEI